MDEDYYRFDFYYKVQITVNLTENPSGVDYDLELHQHKNIRYSKANDIETIGFSFNSSNNSEKITKTILPGTYYVRVYPYGSNSWNETNPYRLSVSISPINPHSTSISSLRSSGAKGAIWKSDFDPFGLTPHTSLGKTEVGYRVNDFTYTYENPFHTKLSNRNIVYSTIYIWDLNLRNQVRNYLIQIYNNLDTSIINQNATAQFMFSVTTTAASIYLGGVGIITAPLDIASLVIGGLFPNKYDTSALELKAYLSLLIGVLETSIHTSDQEVVMLRTRYIYSRNTYIVPGLPIPNYTYFVDFSGNAYANLPTLNNLYESNEIYSRNPEGFMSGSVSGIKTANDVKTYLGY